MPQVLRPYVNHDPPSPVVNQLPSKFELRVQTDGEITPRDAVKQACEALVKNLAALNQEFVKEVELRKVVAEGPNGMDR